MALLLLAAWCQCTTTPACERQGKTYCTSPASLDLSARDMSKARPKDMTTQEDMTTKPRDLLAPQDMVIDFNFKMQQVPISTYTNPQWIGSYSHNGQNGFVVIMQNNTGGSELDFFGWVPDDGGAGGSFSSAVNISPPSANVLYAQTTDWMSATDLVDNYVYVDSMNTKEIFLPGMATSVLKNMTDIQSFLFSHESGQNGQNFWAVEDAIGNDYIYAYTDGMSAMLTDTIAIDPGRDAGDMVMPLIKMVVNLIDEQDLLIIYPSHALVYITGDKSKTRYLRGSTFTSNSSIMVSNLIGDSNIDIAIANGQTKTISLLEGRTNQIFSEHADLLTIPSSSDIELMNFSAIQQQELAVLDSEMKLHLYQLAADPAGGIPTLQEETVAPDQPLALDGITDMVFDDVNGDGLADILLLAPSTINVLLRQKS